MKRQLECAVCGQDAGRWEQHWNRDKGYGICKSCVKWLREIQDEIEIRSSYGQEGVNYESRD